MMIVYLWKHRLVGTTCFAVLAVTLLFSAWRIYSTSKYLQSFRDYTVARDTSWAPAIAEIRDRQEQILDRLSRIEARLDRR